MPHPPLPLPLPADDAGPEASRSSADDTSAGGGILPAALTAWLDARAEDLDAGPGLAAEVVPRLGAAGLFKAGVPAALGGLGGTTADAIGSIAAVAAHSLTAAFVFWGQRSFIEFLLQSPNAALRARWLAPLLAGESAGATGLSNAMKHLAGIEALQVDATRTASGWQLDGSLAWITNLRKEGFIAAAAVNMPGGAPPAVVAFGGSAADDGKGVVRSADLDLIALRGSNTAAVRLDAARVDDGAILHENAQAWLPAVRPAFLGMQCGLSLGLARAALDAAQALPAGMRTPLLPRIGLLRTDLEAKAEELKTGVAEGRFQAAAAPLFRLRIALAGIVQQAVMLELQARGGQAYLQARDGGFARRWREAAFIPIVTPSLLQLQAALDGQA